MTYFIDLRADSAGGNPVACVGDITVRSDTQLNPNPFRPLDSGLIQAVKGKDVLLGTHGFNVNRFAGIADLSHWGEWLEVGADGFFVGVLWPGDARWIPVVDYPIEGNEAIQSGQLLANYLVASFAGVSSLSFVSHSLGARMVLETIRNLPKSFKLRTLTVMAGAIDDDCLSDEYKDVAVRMDKISVLASRCDDVLMLAFPLGNPVAGIVTRGEAYWHGALGRDGPNPPDQPGNLLGTRILPSSWRFGHHSYIDCVGSIAGPPSESGCFFPPAVVVPPEKTPAPTRILNWQQAWTAGFVSTRFR